MLPVNAQKILLVDDEPDIIEFLSYNLEKEGYIVLTATNGKDAIRIAAKEIPHLVILDVMMPGLNGIETCGELRKEPKLKNTLITFLTARNEDYTQVAGFEAGGDDYIQKPIKPKVLMSRVKALLRRTQADAAGVVEIGGLEINREKYRVRKGEHEFVLPRKEFELLSLLVSKPGKVFPRAEILDRVWGGDVVVGDRTIDVHIRKLREKLGDDYIKTVKGVGYKFEF